MIGLYPEIARFKFRNKWLNINIPIRIKLITMTYYCCPECNEKGKLKQLINWAEHYNKRKHTEKEVEWGWEYHPEKRIHIPTKIMENGRISHCAICYAEKNKKVRVKTETEQMYKVYAQTNPKDILLDSILASKLYLNYKIRFHKEDSFKQYESFHKKEDGLKIIYRQLTHSKKMLSSNIKRTEKCSLIIKKNITDKILEEANDISEQNKFIKKI